MVIEYNCRLGDPETEVVIPRLKNDLVDLLKAVADKKLHEKTIEIDNRVAATMVAVSRGYPGSYEKGFPISGLDIKHEESLIFHSGTLLVNNRSGHKRWQGTLCYFLCRIFAGRHPQVDECFDTNRFRRYIFQKGYWV